MSKHESWSCEFSSPYHVGDLRLFSISGHGPQPLIYPHFQARLDLSSMFTIWFPTDMGTAFFLRGIPRHSHPSKAYQCSSSRRSPHYRPPPLRNAPLQSRCFQISKPCRSPAKWMAQEYKQQGLVMAGDCIDCWAWLQLIKWYRNYSSDFRSPYDRAPLASPPHHATNWYKLYTRQRITNLKKTWRTMKNQIIISFKLVSPWSEPSFTLELLKLFKIFVNSELSVDCGIKHSESTKQNRPTQWAMVKPRRWPQRKLYKVWFPIIIIEHVTSLVIIWVAKNGARLPISSYIIYYIILHIPSIITIRPHSEEITSMTSTVERTEAREYPHQQHAPPERIYCHPA